IGTTVFDARIAPVDNPDEELVIKTTKGLAVAMNANPGETAEKVRCFLTYPEGAVETPQAIRLAKISPQAIQGQLPAGWSPLAAVDFRFLNATGNPLKKPCGLLVGKKSYWELDNPYALMLVRWDEEIYRWVSVKHMSLNVDTISSTVDRPGQYVFVIQDPRPVLIYPKLGEPLPVLPDCTLSLPVNSVTNSDLKFTPSEIYPGQTPTAVWTINPAEGGTFSSGVKVQANVSERYELLSGAEAGFTPYITDLTIYNNGSTTGRVEFSVSPNSKISLAE
ncbi:MAG: hypothetical protein GY737_30350, partial [Desulfobacteraceae bacterium]|nr:hypothetical protein [Desulfobacteraceae bacterium]